MAATPTPIFAQTPIGTPVAVSATAQTQRTQFAGAVPTNGVAITPATNPNGTRIDSIVLTGTGTTLAGVITIWVYDGTNSNMVDELTVSAVTPSTTSAGFLSTKVYSTFSLPPGCRLYACSQVASQLVNVTVYGGQY